MPQVPILAGIYADGSPNLRSALPRNLVPVPKSSGVSEGYLRPGDGLILHATGPGLDRGGVVWRGRHFRVMGTRFVEISTHGIVQDIGTVGHGGYCRFAYSFDHLAVASGGRLYLFNGESVAQVTDPDLGKALSVEWVDGYFAVTDGRSIPVTDLTNPFSINPLRYGSSEADADPIVSLLKLRNELHAVNRYSTEVFQNIGGNGFPLQRVPSALVQRGTVGPLAACVFGDYIAMVGGGRGEAPGVWLLASGSTAKVSTREVETLIEAASPEEQAEIVVEHRSYRSHEHLHVHLPDRCLVFDARASKEMERPIWFQLDSGVAEPATYRARGIVEHAGQWYAGDPTSDAVSVMTDTTAHHLGSVIQHEFSTPMLYLNGHGGVIHEMELVTMPGAVQ